jgi:unsaturated rhamnogalacturonyl hydrolase
MDYYNKMVKVADTFVKDNDPTELTWSWGAGLVMYTLSLLDDALGETRYFDYYKKYVDYHAAKGIVVDQSDTCAPALVANELYKKTKDKKYEEITKKGIDYLLNEPRLVGNLINHNGHSHDSKTYPKSIWVDSMMMSGVFSAIASKDFHNEELKNFALSQPKEFKKYLQDPASKLFHHSWWKILKRAYPKKFFWGRGNGWVVASLSLFLNHLDDACARQTLEEISQVLYDYQRKDFYFDTVINKPNDNYRESSATALIAAGWLNGVNQGYLSSKYGKRAAKAYEAIIDDLEISDHGYYMTEISSWTIPMIIAPYRLKFGPYPGYKYVKKGKNIPYGIASLILAGLAYKTYKKS